ncbi:MAG: hypothetical protein WBL74_04155, partial [Novosphingobium sp.]|uniref:hypothetical protein n=1 Tax=Novosphingobium sp. TaxID=1874826 RepID=UPI003C79A27D
DAPQRRDQIAVSAAVQTWRKRAQFARLEREIASFAAGEPLDALPVLTQLFRPGCQAAERLVDALIAPLITALSGQPLGEVPLRHYVDDRSALLVLSQSGGAALTLQVIEPSGRAPLPRARTVTFTPGLAHERILAGAGEADLVSLKEQLPDRVDLMIEQCRLAAGECLFRDSGRQSRMIRSVTKPLVILRLQRRGGAGELTREYALSDGRFLAQAAASPRETRLELVAALLGRMGRSDAAPLLAAMAEEEAAQSLRWQSLKESLGLDTAIGFAALQRIAGRDDDALAAPAGALRAQLIETYPQLKGIAACQE